MPLAAFPNDHHRNNGQRDRGINPIAMTIINPRKEHWPSPGIEPVLKACTYRLSHWALPKVK